MYQVSFRLGKRRHNTGRLITYYYIGCSFKFVLKVGVEESIYGEHTTHHYRVKTQITQKVRLDFNSAL
jgi:hypothetical protein